MDTKTLTSSPAVDLASFVSEHDATDVIILSDAGTVQRMVTIGPDGDVELDVSIPVSCNRADQPVVETVTVTLTEAPSPAGRGRERTFRGRCLDHLIIRGRISADGIGIASVVVEQ